MVSSNYVLNNYRVKDNFFDSQGNIHYTKGFSVTTINKDFLYLVIFFNVKIMKFFISTVSK